MVRKRMPKAVIFALLTFLLLAACKGDAETAVSEPKQETVAEAPAVEPTAVSPTKIPAPTKTAVPPILEPPSPEPEPTAEPVLAPLAADPQPIEFEAEDGQALQGIYYPAAQNPAPLIVLMHWAPGDQTDWPEIAYWLQNRGQGGNTPNPENRPWLDSSWFPEMADGRSFAVFTFTFRGCEGGCSSFERDKWLLDAQAALETAVQLEGIDPTQIAAIGASIGSDGAPDGCHLFNAAHDDGSQCLGAFSLSPGSYLTLDYAEIAASLGMEDPPKPVWCLFADGDSSAANACNGASGAQYRSIGYAGSAHGMELVTPDMDPNVLGLMVEFLELVFP